MTDATTSLQADKQPVAVVDDLTVTFATDGGAVDAVKGVSIDVRPGEVLALVGHGLTNTEIAERLYLSPLTAKTHVSRIITKLGARDRVHLVVLAYETGLVRPGQV